MSVHVRASGQGRHLRWLFFLLVIFVFFAGCEHSTNDHPSKSPAITFIGWGPATLRELSADQDVIERFTKETGIRVDFIAGPESMTDRLELYRKYFAEKASTPDVYYVDVVWPAIIAPDVVDLNSELRKEANELLDPLVRNDTVNGKLTSMPFNTEIGLLYYRADLLKKYGYSHPPGSWDELEKMAERIQAGERAAGKRDFWGFVWQGAPYEGLTCNALEWQVSYGAGQIIETDGTISVNNAKTIAALKRARGWIGKISPPGVLAFKEQDSRNVWSAGNAAFARDWVWRQYKAELMEPSLQDNVGVVLLPAGPAGHAAALGGQSLAISKYSAHPKEAEDLVRFLTKRDTQMSLWKLHAMLPTRRDFYADANNLKGRPEVAEVWSELERTAVARPSVVTGDRYDQVSRAYFSAVHSALTGEVQPENAMAELETKLSQITGLKPGAPPQGGAAVH